jgi:hypothetical protein
MLNEHNNIIDVILYPACFINDLALGTILFGTCFSINYFSCENIYFYKGRHTGHLPFEFKLNMIGHIFKNNEIKQYAYTKKCLILGLPIYKESYEEALSCITTLPYNVYAIQEASLQYIIGIHLIKTEIKKEAVFKIKAEVHPDIYNLYCWGKDTPYGHAIIPSYKSSVMMNGIFRHIKENKNLDLLEESDDEEEFENINENKFVDLEKTLIMKCVYNKKFRKWQPIEVINANKVKLITYKELQYLEKS